MTAGRFSPSCFLWIATIASLGLSVSACGRKNSVQDNESDQAPNKTEPRSRLTGGSGTTTSMNYCRFPLELGTMLDPRRPGLMQTVLSTPIDSRCANSREARVYVRTRQRLTVVGRFVCQSGNQSDEQICIVSAQDILSPQKTALTLTVIAEESLRPSDVDASVELY